MPRALVVCFEPADAPAIADRIRRGGFDPEICPVRAAAGLRAVGQNPPDVVVIDLLRMPSYGRWFGAQLRQRKSTRSIPLVFIEGDPRKTKLVRKLLPDAVYTPLPDLGEAAARAVRNRPAEPVIPDVTALPAAAKLGIGRGDRVALVDAPEGIGKALGPLPRSARFACAVESASLILLFARSSVELARKLPALARETPPEAKLWVLWPKKTSGLPSDLNPQRIFEMSASFGLAAHKLCAVDRTWSALAISRKPRRARG